MQKSTCANVETYASIKSLPSVLLVFAYKNNHQLIIAMQMQYVEHSQAKNVAITHHALLNGPQLSMSNENNFITSRYSGVWGLAAKFLCSQVTTSHKRASKVQGLH